MEPNDAGAAPNRRTVAQLQGGVPRVGMGSAIPAISGREQMLGATGLPGLRPVVENLAALGTRLASEEFGAAAEAGRLLAVPEELVKVVSAGPYGSPIALSPTQLGVRLDTGGAALLQGGRS